ncbi:acetyltransferase-3 [Coleophoma crateriformis]|uniref:Acetyltransferase-3 n=1 Tax=Coleophoma crateriformis TaxID=565419 RepID=A0A3D8QUV0_9HELO|nr:acetyltransferase-3 [Coleophoma crateriformis]
MGAQIDVKENEARMQRGELYHAFESGLVAKRQRCQQACSRFNAGGHLERRRLVELFRDITGDKSPLPAAGISKEEDSQLLADEPYIEGPFLADYGFNVRFGKGVFVNFNSVWLDTCTITVGARTLIGPNCAFYSGTHPLDPFLRNGTNGPELGKPIEIGEDCWLGGNVIVLPGVTIGRGCTVGAGSVVTKDVPEFHCVAGNPARIIRKIEVKHPDPAVLP